jgi:protein subunit release factor B
VDTNKWPHTKTLHKTRAEIKNMRAWLREHVHGADFRIEVRATKRGQQTGIESVIVRIDSDDEYLWFLFKLVWG